MATCCPICRGTDTAPILSLGGLPVASNAQTTPEEASSVPRGDLDLVACTACTHLFNAAFDPGASSYDSSYENSLHFSAHFQEHARALARRLVDDHGLRGEAVAEAGAGPGHFLTMLCEAGVDRAFGFDPSYDPGRLGAPEHPRVRLSQGVFPTGGSIKPKLALTQHVLEHLTEPVNLLRQLRAAIEDQPGGGVYSEVPNGQLMIERCALWDLIYEHYSYFTPVSLVHAAQRAGLSSDRVLTAFDDQFLSVEASPVSESATLPAVSVVEPVVERAVAFGEEVRRRIDQARIELDRLLAAGPVALWGAGSKGMTYLNLVASEGQIGAIIDVNPRKSGFGVPGVPGVVQAPEVLAVVQPATVLIANPIYASEIEATLRGLGVEAQLQALWV